MGVLLKIKLIRFSYLLKCDKTATTSYVLTFLYTNEISVTIVNITIIVAWFQIKNLMFCMFCMLYICFIYENTIFVRSLLLQL